MNRVTMTDRWVRSVKASEGARDEYLDTATPGLTLRVTAKSKTWSVQFRKAGTRRRVKLGTYPNLSLADARQKATQVKEGSTVTLAQPRRGDKAAALDAMLEAYCARMESRGQPAAGTYRAALITGEHSFAAYARKTFKRMPAAAEITPAVVTGWLREAHDRAPFFVRDLRSYLHAAFAWAVRAEHDPTVPAEHALNFGVAFNPVSAVASAPRRTPQPKPIPFQELQTVWNALPDFADPRTVIALRHIIAMGGLRLTEILTSKKEYYREDWLHLPKTKTEAAHDVPLTRHALEQYRIAVALAPARSPYLYPNANDVGRPMVLDGLSKVIRKMREPLGLTEWTPRQVRATFKTYLIETEYLDERHIDLWHGHGVNADVARKHYDAAERRSMKLRAAGQIDKFLDEVLTVQTPLNLKKLT